MMHGILALMVPSSSFSLSSQGDSASWNQKKAENLKTWNKFSVWLRTPAVVQEHPQYKGSLHQRQLS
jgi:hypothetical protein